MKFIKGNDYIVIDTPSNIDVTSFTKKYCDRNFGIGADGVLIISPSKNADAKMRIINSDGSEAEMCGNGIRCVAKYLIENGATSPLKIETLAGIKTVEKIGDNYKVDMGIPNVTSTTTTITINQKPNKFIATLVDIGNPHCVIFVDDFNFNWQTAGKEIETNEIFTNRSNVEFVKVISPTELEIKVWERGVGATLACGTGACASLAAAVANNKSEKKVVIKLSGENLKIELAEDNHIYMTGPAVTVFEGEISV